MLLKQNFKNIVNLLPSVSTSTLIAASVIFSTLRLNIFKYKGHNSRLNAIQNDPF